MQNEELIEVIATYGPFAGALPSTFQLLMTYSFTLFPMGKVLIHNQDLTVITASLEYRFGKKIFFL